MLHFVRTCGAGALHDLASALLGGPTGHELRGEAFERARAYVVEVLGGASGTAAASAEQEAG